MNEFKPGDVVVHPEHGRGIVTADGEGGGSLWTEFAPGVTIRLRVVAANLRRLVVIDPEGREEVERLRDLMDVAWVDQGNGQVEARTRGARGNAMQAALREFADPKPPKPEEPTGLGAVVEDFCGHRYVRTGWPEAPWCNVSEEQSCAWAHVAAVRVLSEGVS